MEVEYLKFEELMKESRREGYDDGRSDGYSDGISAGIELGEQRGIGTVAAKMKAEGLPVEIIKKTTGLDYAAIEKL
jgi:flagellar biosynthesis/type III secretory pathway protein FliH